MSPAEALDGRAVTEKPSPRLRGHAGPVLRSPREPRPARARAGAPRTGRNAIESCALREERDTTAATGRRCYNAHGSWSTTRIARDPYGERRGILVSESIPDDKGILKPAQVCQALGIQPYQLKFWETEFADLGRRVGPKRLYGPEEMDLVSEIKSLLVDSRVNLSEARAILAERFATGDDDGAKEGSDTPGSASNPESESGPDSRARVRELETRWRSAESKLRVLEKALEAARKELEQREISHRAEVSAERATSVGLREALDSSRREARGAAEELTREQAKTRSLRDELAGVRRKADAAEARLSQLASAEDELSVLRAALEGRNAELEQRTEELNAREAEIASLESLLSSSEKAGAQLTRDIERLRTRLAAVEAEAAQSLSRVERTTEMEAELERARLAIEALEERRAEDSRDRERLRLALDAVRSEASRRLEAAELRSRELANRMERLLVTLAPPAFRSERDAALEAHSVPAAQRRGDAVTNTPRVAAPPRNPPAERDTARDPG